MSDVQLAMADVATLQQRLAAALDADDRADVDRLLAELTVAEKRRNRLLQRASGDAGGAFDAAPPVREQVASVLSLLSRPASVSLIRDVATARFGEPIQPSRLASLRRDEQRSWHAAHREDGSGMRSLARPVYIVPALTFDRYAPVRGMLALSSWALEARLIAPASPRVDILRVTIRLIDELEQAGDAPWAPNLRRLVWRFARSVAGAIDAWDGSNYDHIREAAERELRQIVDDDTAERAEAARRARDQLESESQLFGTSLKVVARTSTKAAG
jgi:hypothetical protein